ncbi:hypothetical protein Pcinc_035707, partial [Petrolisthes cinctipes]
MCVPATTANTNNDNIPRSSTIPILRLPDSLSKQMARTTETQQGVLVMGGREGEENLSGSGEVVAETPIEEIIIFGNDRDDVLFQNNINVEGRDVISEYDMKNEGKQRQQQQQRRYLYFTQQNSHLDNEFEEEVLPSEWWGEEPYNYRPRIIQAAEYEKTYSGEDDSISTSIYPILRRQNESFQGDEEGERESQVDEEDERENEGDDEGERNSERDEEGDRESQGDGKGDRESERNDEVERESEGDDEDEKKSEGDDEVERESEGDDEGDRENERDDKGERESEKDNKGERASVGRQRRGVGVVREVVVLSRPRRAGRRQQDEEDRGPSLRDVVEKPDPALKDLVIEKANTLRGRSEG